MLKGYYILEPWQLFKNNQLRLEAQKPPLYRSRFSPLLQPEVHRAPIHSISFFSLGPSSNTYSSLLGLWNLIYHLLLLRLTGHIPLLLECCHEARHLYSRVAAPDPNCAAFEIYQVYSESVPLIILHRVRTTIRRSL